VKWDEATRSSLSVPRRPATLIGMWTCALALAVALGAHPGSLSRSRIVVAPGEVRHDFRFQALTLIETLPFDVDANLVLDEAELGMGRMELEAYLAEHYRLHVGEAAEPLVGEVVRVETFLEGSPELPTSAWIEVERRFPLEGEARALRLEETLFEDSNPQHIEYVTIAWEGQVPVDHVFQYGHTDHRFEPSGEVQHGPLRAFLGLGVDHILTGYDHLLFLLALLVAAPTLRALAWTITAFTAAHSITLALAALEVVTLPGRFVEIAIALSIAYVAAENLLRLEKRSLWLEALVFGLLHGLGFAGFLGEALQGEEELVVPLLGFNLGVELGQLLFVVPLALLLRGLSALLGRRAEAPAPPRLVPERLGLALSALIALAGLYWFVERSFLA
jgi:hydrogenase/urease accessory protein HupE